jgi:protease I
MLMTDGVEQVEYTSPRNFLEEHGARVILLSPKAVGEAVQAFNHNSPGDTFNVEMNVRDARPADFDALVLPGGAANADKLRHNQEAVSFIREYGEEDRPVAAICHGPLALIDAGMAQSRHMTSWPSLQTELRDAGAEWTDDQVVVDDKLITSRNPGDIPAFNDALMNELMVGAGTDPGPTS